MNVGVLDQGDKYVTAATIVLLREQGHTVSLLCASYGQPGFSAEDMNNLGMHLRCNATGSIAQIAYQTNNPDLPKDKIVGGELLSIALVVPTAISYGITDIVVPFMKKDMLQEQIHRLRFHKGLLPLVDNLRVHAPFWNVEASSVWSVAEIIKPDLSTLIDRCADWTLGQTELMHRCGFCNSCLKSGARTRDLHVIVNDRLEINSILHFCLY